MAQFRHTLFHEPEAVHHLFIPHMAAGQLFIPPEVTIKTDEKVQYTNE
jgi:hypothetical protein